MGYASQRWKIVMTMNQKERFVALAEKSAFLFVIHSRRPIMYPDPQAIDELVRRIVEAVHPQRVVLFGSAARGEMGPHSDLDVLVIMPDGTHRRKTAQEIYRRMWGFGFAKDIVVVTESDVREYGTNPYMIIKNALEEGRELYHATG